MLFYLIFHSDVEVKLEPKTDPLEIDPMDGEVGEKKSLHQNSSACDPLNDFEGFAVEEEPLQKPLFPPFLKEEKVDEGLEEEPLHQEVDGSETWRKNLSREYLESEDFEGFEVEEEPMELEISNVSCKHGQNNVTSV